MRNIRLFDEYSEFLAKQEAVSGSGKYVEDIFPGFAYVRERFSGETPGEYAFYNGHEDSDYEFGDVIYLGADGKLKKVYWTDYTPSMGDKVGLIVVPTSHAADGNARMIAFQNALYGGETEVMNNEYNWDSPLKYDGPLCWDIPSWGSEDYIYYVGEVPMNYYYPYLSCDYANGYATILNPLASNERWSASQPEGGGEGAASSEPLFGGTGNPEGYYSNHYTQLVLSPYLEDGSLNPNYVDSAWTQFGDTLYNGLADWGGFANTHAIQDGNEPAADSAKEYSTTGTNAGDWYVGALGEMGYVTSRLWAVEYIMNQLGGSTLLVPSPWSHNHREVYLVATSTELINSPGHIMTIHVSDDAGSVQPGKFVPSGCYPSEIPTPDINMYYVGLTDSADCYTVRPMAMIKNGEIQRG